MVKARALCAKQERCRSELLARFEAWGVDEADHAALIERLETDCFLNERRYTEHFAVSKLRQNGWGKRKIQAALAEKRIGEGDIAFALASIDAEEYLRVAQRIAGKRADPEDARRLLTGRGFEWDLIDRVLRE